MWKLLFLVVKFGAWACACVCVCKTTSVMLPWTLAISAFFSYSHAPVTSRKKTNCWPVHFLAHDRFLRGRLRTNSTCLPFVKLLTKQFATCQTRGEHHNAVSCRAQWSFKGDRWACWAIVELDLFNVASKDKVAKFVDLLIWITKHRSTQVMLSYMITRWIDCE